MKAISLGHNQIITIDDEGNQTFQSYNSAIATKTKEGNVYFDKQYYKFSRTIIKYRNKFIKEDSKTIEKKIKDGTYKLRDLN
jgi:hypothetical protein